MGDQEKIRNFGDMVDATERLAAPWRKAFAWTLITLVVTNILWGAVAIYLVYCAYMTPAETYQTQNIKQETQSQSYSTGPADSDNQIATNGD